jgi:hypothetical protein
MKTKFKPILNIKKQAVKKVEQELMKINSRINIIKNEILTIEDEIV